MMRKIPCDQCRRPTHPLELIGTPPPKNTPRIGRAKVYRVCLRCLEANRAKKEMG